MKQGDEAYRPGSAGPWARFFARTFDLVLEVWACGFVAGFVIVMFWNGLPGWLHASAAHRLFAGLCVIGVTFPVDACIHGVFGNTPGKAILGLAVRGPDNAPPRMSRVLLRNMGVWIEGLGFALPVVCWIPCLYQYVRLRGAREATYDTRLGTRVVQRLPVDWRRRVLFTIWAVTLLVGISMVNTALAACPPSPAIGMRRWTNPLTGRKAGVGLQWRMRRHAGLHHSITYRFYNPKEGVIVDLARVDLSRLPAARRTVPAILMSMRRSAGDRYSVMLVPPAHRRGTPRVVEVRERPLLRTPKGWRESVVDLRFTLRGVHLWTVVTHAPKGCGDPVGGVDAAALRRALWGTVPGV